MDIFTGSSQIEVKDTIIGVSFPVLLHYPTIQPSSETAFGPYVMDVSTDAPVMEGQFPLVVISHGNGGSHLLYRTISTYLARRGYIVAMPEHYGNNRHENHLAETIENLKYRPRHVSLTIDSLLESKPWQNSMASGKVAVIGHSMGGYTALALAGAIPRTREGKLIEVSADPRVKALVLLAPGTGWFWNSMDNVNIPILMLTAEFDAVTPAWNAGVVMESIPDKTLLTSRMIKDAGHFSFLSPFPASMKNPHFLPSTDPHGFDREEFHRKLPAEILGFLQEKLGGS